MTKILSVLLMLIFVRPCEASLSHNTHYTHTGLKPVQASYLLARSHFLPEYQGSTISFSADEKPVTNCPSSYITEDECKIQGKVPGGETCKDGSGIHYSSCLCPENYVAVTDGHFCAVKSCNQDNVDYCPADQLKCENTFQKCGNGMKGGGIWPAIVGTFYLMVGSALFAFPLGIMSGIYMNEYAPKGKVVRFIRMMTNNLAGIPSIVFGLFGMSLFVGFFGFGDSIIAGSLTLGLLALPLVIRTTEEALKAIPDSFREGSLALGASKLQTIWHVILPMGMPNIITGLILALGRVSGETAPILFTCAAYFLPQLPESVFDQCMALPYHLYVLATSGTDMDKQLPIAYGTALVLVIIVLLVNLLANALRNYFQKKLKTN